MRLEDNFTVEMWLKIESASAANSIELVKANHQVTIAIENLS
jgi:hypothetical protein